MMQIILFLTTDINAPFCITTFDYIFTSSKFHVIVKIIMNLFLHLAFLAIAKSEIFQANDQYKLTWQVCWKKSIFGQKHFQDPWEFLYKICPLNDFLDGELHSILTLRNLEIGEHSSYSIIDKYNSVISIINSGN